VPLFAGGGNHFSCSEILRVRNKTTSRRGEKGSFREEKEKKNPDLQRGILAGKSVKQEEMRLADWAGLLRSIAK